MTSSERGGVSGAMGSMVERGKIQEERLGEWLYNRNMQVFQRWNTDVALCTLDVFIRNPIDIGQLWSISEHVNLGRTACCAAGIDDLIVMVAQAGRPEDLRDIDEPRHILQLTGREGS